MSLLVVGSVAFDTIITPQERRERIIGGSASYFAFAASLFCKTHLVGVVGYDWPDEYTRMFETRGVDVSMLQKSSDEKTFFWEGKYLENMIDRETLDTQMNSLEHFVPNLNEQGRKCKYVFLANGSPITQLETLEQCENPNLVVADTMNLFISIQNDELRKLMKRVNGFILNDSEARMLTGFNNLMDAGRAILDMGPEFVIIKKGEHGSLFFGENTLYALPAFPTAKIVDPTGAGDSFGGAFMGYIAEKESSDSLTLKQALAYATVMGSFTVEGFSLDLLAKLTREKLDERYHDFIKMLQF